MPTGTGAARSSSRYTKVGKRLTDRADMPMFGILRTQQTIGHMHGCLGNAVHVDEIGFVRIVQREPFGQRADLQGLAAQDHVAEPVRRRWVRRLRCQQLPKGTRSLVQDGDAAVPDQTVEITWRSSDFVWDNDGVSTIYEGPPDLPDGEVECVGMK